MVAEQKQLRYQHYMKLYRKYKKLQDRWNATHRDEEDGASTSRWKDDGDSKREKRAFRLAFLFHSLIATRSMARITRSQTSNMVECESITSRVRIN